MVQLLCIHREFIGLKDFPKRILVKLMKIDAVRQARTLTHEGWLRQMT